MILVACNKSGDKRLLHCVGHAGFEPGKDIVCAAMSALSGSLVATLLKHEDEFLSLFYQEGDGECRVVCTGEAAAPYFEFALVGMHKLEQEFPSNICIFGDYEGEKNA